MAPGHRKAKPGEKPSDRIAALFQKMNKTHSGKPPVNMKENNTINKPRKKQ